MTSGGPGSSRGSRWLNHSDPHLLVTDADVRYLGSLETAVAEGEVVSILPAGAGGAERRPVLALDRETIDQQRCC